MTEADDEDDLPLTDLTAILVLGAGFVGLVLDVDWFWAIWLIGFVAVLPLVDILEGRIQSWLSDDGDRSPEEDALEQLKGRYARGDIDDREFERRLERLVENESIDDVEARLGDDHRTRTATERDREPEFER